MAAGESKTADYGVVLKQIVDRLHNVVKACNVSNCYLTLNPDELPSNPGDHCYAVAPVSGAFDEGAFTGAGIAALGTKCGFVVKIHCPSLGDQGGRDAMALTDEALGIFRQAKLVIRALASFSADHPPVVGWVPNLLGVSLTSTIRPTGFTIHKNDNGAVRSIELPFEFDFDWDFSGD